MAKTINMKLSTADIRRVKQELQEKRGKLDALCIEFARRLATIGAMRAAMRFSNAFVDEELNDVQVDVVAIPHGYKVVASGTLVCFVEFGTGIYYNGSEPYPKPRPAGIVGIGQYGKGNGAKNAWGYYDEDGKLHITHGIPAAMPMYYASEDMRSEIQRIAREVFAQW